MFTPNLNLNEYTSCIKIFGVPILPPLITDEKRKEINDDKQRAIEIEKKLKGKRSSVDSGVMTGSYIDHFKSTEYQQGTESQLDQSSVDDLFYQKGFENHDAMRSLVAGNDVSDSFLKSALEDPEFRAFFSTTAEKIFKDNKIENILDLNGENGLHSFGLKDVCSNEGEIQCSEVLGLSDSSFQRDPGLFSFSFNDNLSSVPSVVESNITVKGSEDLISGDESDNKRAEEIPSPLPPRIRRNSYTLDSPSPVLLEHMAKEKANSKVADKWQTLPDKKEKIKGPGFKTFSGRSQRKHWNKNICNQSSILGVENYHTKYTLRKSNTFVKPERKVVESNYSLPASSRTSPLQYIPLTRSVDCLKSLGVNPLYEMDRKGKGDFSESSESVGKVSVPNIRKNLTDAASDSETFIVQKTCELQSASSETLPSSLINNPSYSVKSYYSVDNCSPPQVEFNDSASQISTATQPNVQQNSVYAPSLVNGNFSNNINHSDFDDLASSCSAMSISIFLPSLDNSRPSTAKDISESTISQLKMKHENELRELLEKQRKEEEMYSQLFSTSGSLASRTLTNLGNNDPFEANSEVLDVDKKESCIRELFPTQTSGEIHTKHFLGYSKVEKEAATKLTACAKGYLTRRLLKTEKVQQLIELIKESLTCAFSLQKEPHLRPNDLELHARLAHQLNAALCELQDIVSAPVATRMAIIAADREKLRRPASRPSSAISAATRKSILRRQLSLNSAEKKPHESRARTKSYSDNGDSVSSGARARSGSSSTVSTASSRLPWR